MLLGVDMSTRGPSFCHQFPAGICISNYFVARPISIQFSILS
uniref:Uncharacterized protein n=1 Tax=Rhizophora mucronata TaxID=61149 RepID=A0A2P2PCG0_RHIMU